MSTGLIFENVGRKLAQAWAMSFPYTCTIKARTPTISTSGEPLYAAATDAYTSVPCLYEPIAKFGWKKDQAEKITATQKFNVFLPTRYQLAGVWTRINLDPDTHYIVTDAIGLAPSVTFSIDSVGRHLDVQFELVATVEG